MEKAQSYCKSSRAESLRIHEDAGREVVGDKVRHGNDEILVELVEQEYRSYISEPERRKWKDKQAEKPTYANRRRIRGMAR